MNNDDFADTKLRPTTESSIEGGLVTFENFFLKFLYLTLTEGQSQQYGVQIDSMPTANVTVHLDVSRQIVIGTFSFLYLLGLGVIMGFFAAHSREYQKFGTLVNLGLLGVLGNVLCCVTSIVIFMPIPENLLSLLQ